MQIKPNDFYTAQRRRNPEKNKFKKYTMFLMKNNDRYIKNYLFTISCHKKKNKKI